MPLVVEGVSQEMLMDVLIVMSPSSTDMGGWEVGRIEEDSGCPGLRSEPTTRASRLDRRSCRVWVFAPLAAGQGPDLRQSSVVGLAQVRLTSWVITLVSAPVSARDEETG